MNLEAKETFVYDEVDGLELESILDTIKFYNEVDVGFRLGGFNFLKELKVFVPVATYHQENSDDRSQEFVSMVEGTYMPFFGFAHRLDKVQFGFHAMADSTEHSNVDHSKVAIEHAQNVANLIVDEARLSANMFEWTNDEQAMLLNNFPLKSVSLPYQSFSPQIEESIFVQ